MNKNRIYPTYFVFGALLLYAVLFVLICWVPGYFLFKKKIYIKI